MDQFLLEQVLELDIPGLSLAVVNDGKIVYHKNLGVVNTATKVSVNNQTMFDAASMSKTVFSFFVLRLVDRNILDLDTPLATYWTDPDIAHDERHKKITARMALSHTTGFPNWRFLEANGNYNPKGKLRIEFEPGSRYQYSGEGFQYLARVVAHLLKTDLNGLQAVMEKEVLHPLDMTHSSFVWNDYLEAQRAHGHTNGKPDAGWSSNSNSPDFNAAASLQSNAAEFGRFLIGLLNGNLLSEESISEMLQRQSVRPGSGTSPDLVYGLGIRLEATPFGTNFHHSGDNGSATAQFLFNDDHKSGFVYFTNMEGSRKRVFNNNLRTFLTE